jgi:hypothetical protein
MGKRPTDPTDNQFETAIMWLQSNEGDEIEAGACNAVADWIERWRTANMLKKVARDAGVSVSQVRKRLAGKGNTDSEMEN